mgnify:CR=1 FL=1
MLKEQVRFDNGIASFDWETYPVLKFSEVPEIDIELINTKDEVPLGVGEVTGGSDCCRDRQRRVACARCPHSRFASDHASGLWPRSSGNSPPRRAARPYAKPFVKTKSRFY